jgi:hypothetical protein
MDDRATFEIYGLVNEYMISACLISMYNLLLDNQMW